MMDKVSVLQGAMNALNKPDQPWCITVEGDSIIGYWRWMDATFFAPAEVTNEIREYYFRVTLNDKGKWHELDHSQSESTSVSGNGFGVSKQAFSGHMTQKAGQIGFGRDNRTGEVGLIQAKFDTAVIKKPIRDYLAYCGWKKAGLFG